MATFIEIDTTTKQGFVKVKMNTLSNIHNIKEWYRRISDFLEVGIAADDSFVEIKISGNNSLFCSFDTQQSQYAPIEIVNGVAPISNEDLKNKLIM